MKYLKMSIVFSLSLIFIVGCNANDETESVVKDNKGDPLAQEEYEDKTEDSQDNEVSEGSEQSEEFGIGDTIEYDGMSMTLNFVRTQAVGEFDTAQEDKFIIADLTVVNNSEEEKTVSSFLNIDLKDDNGIRYNVIQPVGGKEDSLDGKIQSGERLEAEVPFNVAESDFYELTYVDPLKTGEAVWTITSHSIQKLR